MRERLEKEHWGDYISINVDNGDYAVASDHFEASQVLKAKYPGIIPVVKHIGYKEVIRRK
ncbi:MAG: hypothetical protein ACREOI_24725 [bacterium]